MEHNHENNHLIDTQEQDMGNNGFKQDSFYDKTNYEFITEGELENIHPDLDHNFPSPKMNSGIMKVNQNDPENIIDGPNYFHQYRR